MNEDTKFLSELISSLKKALSQRTPLQMDAYLYSMRNDIGNRPFYLTIPAETAASRNALRLAFDDEDEATGISATLTNSEEVNSAIYDLQGRRVEQPQPGLYIRNGKKVIIK